MKDENLMQKFIEDRKNLDAINDYISYSEEGGRSHLVIGHPAILATFMGYLKFQTHRRRGWDWEVFFRGQTDNYDKIIPSLLRGKDFAKINICVKAYNELKESLPKLFKSTRFKNEDLDNIFQHYGIKSQSLDLVDNLYVAIWFATNQFVKLNGFENLCTYKRSENEFGWIYFFEFINPDAELRRSGDIKFDRYVDLRKGHSSLSARLHCQHGISYSRQIFEEYNENNRAFDDLLIATVKFPNNDEFKMDGTLFSKEFIFPNSEIDNTYKLLRQKKCTELIHRIEDKHKLNRGDLGQIWAYNF